MSEVTTIGQFFELLIETNLEEAKKQLELWKGSLREEYWKIFENKPINPESIEEFQSLIRFLFNKKSGLVDKTEQIRFFKEFYEKAVAILDQ